MLAEILLTLAALAAVALSAVCYVQVRRSIPVAIVEAQKRAQAQLQDVLDRQESHGIKLVTWREDLENLLESVEGTLASVEKKRRSAAASASKIAGDAPEFDPANIDHLRARARAMGHTDVM